MRKVARRVPLGRRAELERRTRAAGGREGSGEVWKLRAAPTPDLGAVPRGSLAPRAPLLLPGLGAAGEPAGDPRRRGGREGSSPWGLSRPPRVQAGAGTCRLRGPGACGHSRAAGTGGHRRAPAGWQVRQRSLRRAARGGRAGGVRAAGPGSRLLPQSVSVTRGPWIHRLHGEGVKGDVLSYPLRSPSPPGSLSLLVRRCSFLTSSRPPAPPNLAPALCSDVGPQEAAGGNPRVPDLGRHCGVRSSLCCPRR